MVLRATATAAPSRPRAAAKGAPASAKQKPAATKKSTAGHEVIPRLRIRMYRHGLGDCLLLRFRRSDGNGTFNLLIDCGIIMVARGAKNVMTRVVEDIAKVCEHRLDVVVMSHEHWDHVSGFSTQQARAVFERITIGEVWYGWTEDPQNELGKRLREERAQKVQALASAVATLAAQVGNPLAIERAGRLGALLGFFGLDLATAAHGKIGKTREAFDYLLKRSGVKTRYCAPGKSPLSLPGVPEMRVYVLGPPQDEGLIKKSSPSKKGKEVYELASESKLAKNIDSAFLRLGGRLPDRGCAMTDDCPFDPMLRRRDGHSGTNSSALDQLIGKTWDASGEQWRRIEDDWTQVAETLALNLDSHTNNTCLVLAFEFTDSGEVFLFPADAQVGSWLSWQDLRWQIENPTGFTQVTGPDLLARTVFYKVGHHGSHNATLSSMGLEQMTHEDLVAFVPVFRSHAKKCRWKGMPFGPLVKRLGEKTGGRLLFSDAALPKAAQLGTLSASAREHFTLNIEADDVDDLWFEYRIV
jgi:hypothetical protein